LRETGNNRQRRVRGGLRPQPLFFPVSVYAGVFLVF
jgi:hypothetical protein